MHTPQVHVCQVNDVAPLQSIVTYVRNCFLPYTRSVAQATQGQKGTVRLIACLPPPSGSHRTPCTHTQEGDVPRKVLTRLQELDIELRGFLQTIDIPQVRRCCCCCVGGCWLPLELTRLSVVHVQVVLEAHPVVKSFAEEMKAKGITDPEDGPKVDDLDSFLNDVQKVSLRTLSSRVDCGIVAAPSARRRP